MPPLAMPRFDRLLLGVGLAHLVLAVACAALLLRGAAPILGLHPAWKPFKFAASIGMYLVTMALLLPALSVGEGTRRVLALALAGTMITEMAVIGTQAARGRRSHFNFELPLDAALTSAMLGGIAVLLVTMGAVTVVATLRPLAQPALLATAWRAALWIFLVAGAVSGMGMGARGGHTIGGVDGGAGMPVTNWSTAHGDLRVSHFFALHALQILPLLAAVMARLPLGVGVQWTLLVLGIGANVALVGGTWFQALAARPAW